MPLSRQNQTNTFRFGGPSRSKDNRDNENFRPGDYLNSVKKEDFTLLFYEWLAQCWIYDNTELVPMTEEQLAEFDVGTLIPLFREKYISGDWQRITEYSGASIDEMALVWQMMHREQILFILNRDQQPPPFLPEMANHTFIPGQLLADIFLGFINESPVVCCQVLVTDGVTHHVILGLSFDQSKGVLLYEDNVGENGTCFLNKQNNALGIDSTFAGHNEYGGWNWEISREDFVKVLYGVPLYKSLLAVWNWIALKIDTERYNKEHNIDLDRDAHTKIEIDI